MVNIKIHRGTNQIGGTITEIFTDNTRIFIDFGSELTVKPEDSTDNQMIEMIRQAKCDAVLFSHYHGDHVGLLSHIPETDITGRKIKLGIGKAARNVMINIHETLVGNNDSSEAERNYHRDLLNLLQDEERWYSFSKEVQSFQIGDFNITPLRVDHSAYDSYLFVIEAEGKCIVHTGDFRMHGRIANESIPLIEKFFKNQKVDVLLMEGTMLGRLDENVMTEDELEEEARILLELPENKYVFLICSSTNMESLASFHRAVLDANKKYDKNRAMYVNFYVRKQMDLFATAEPKITKGFIKAYQFSKFLKGKKILQEDFRKENGFLMLIGASESYEKYINPYLDKNPLLIYSMWDGYIQEDNDAKNPAMIELVNRFKRKKILHTSGHATKVDLEKMIKMVNPQEAIIPMHTEYKDRYYVLEGVEDKVHCMEDGEVFVIV